MQSLSKVNRMRLGVPGSILGLGVFSHPLRMDPQERTRFQIRLCQMTHTKFEHPPVAPLEIDSGPFSHPSKFSS